MQIAYEIIEFYETRFELHQITNYKKKFNNKIVDKVIDKTYNIELLSINRKIREITTQLIFIQEQARQKQRKS